MQRLQSTALGMALVVKAERETARVAAYAVVLKRLSEIREDLTAEAPNRWEDLLPPDWDTNTELLEQGKALVLEEKQAIRKAAEARRSKINEGLLKLGIIKKPEPDNPDPSPTAIELMALAREIKGT